MQQTLFHLPVPACNAQEEAKVEPAPGAAGLSCEADLLAPAPAPAPAHNAQEEAKVAALSQRLAQLGIDVEPILAAVAAESGGADGEDEDVQ